MLKLLSLTTNLPQTEQICHSLECLRT